MNSNKWFLKHFLGQIFVTVIIISESQLVDENSCLRFFWYNLICTQSQSIMGAVIKMCSENMQQIYRITLMPKCEFNKFALQMKSHFSMGVLL